MTMPDEEILVAFGIDLAYAPHLATVIASVVANAPGASFCFMVIHDGLPEAEIAKISSVAADHKFQWCEIKDSRVLDFATRHHISRATYYRFAIAGFAPECFRRAIYLDSDLVVLGDLRELWHSELKGAPIGAVKDGFISSQEFAEKWQLASSAASYFNAGVLVLDLDELRRDNILETAVELLQERWEDFPWGDQDALNLMFWNRWTQIETCWNIQRRMLVPMHAARRFTDRVPKIVHYTEAEKPWLPGTWHPLAGLYFRYLKHTPYWNTINASAGMTWHKRMRHRLRTWLTLAQLSGRLPPPQAPRNESSVSMTHGRA